MSITAETLFSWDFISHQILKTVIRNVIAQWLHFVDILTAQNYEDQMFPIKPT